MSSDQTLDNISSSSPPDFQLLDIEAVALRGLAARDALLKAEVERVTLEILQDRATVYGSIEARLGLPAGSIINGLCQIEGDSIKVKVERPEEKGFALVKEVEDGQGGDDLRSC
jgi:hypothetical protein